MSAICWQVRQKLLMTVIATSFLLVWAPSASALDNASIQVPLVSPGEAIALLNGVRAANGIPGDLQEVPELSQGCMEYLDDYQPAPGQYPHEERPEQPGYTPGGAKAVSMSDLAGRLYENAPTGSYGLAWWTPRFTPWSDAPLHLTDLLDPAATSAWYGENHTEACMGTFAYQRSFQEPVFYSYPGAGSTDVPIGQTANELPWTPQRAAGIPAHQATGPNIILFQEGLREPNLLGAALATASGLPVPVALANPASPEPTPEDSSFPTGYTVGEYSRGAAFAIPPDGLAADTSFVLTVRWEDRATAAQYVQSVPFTTGTQTLEQMLPQLPVISYQQDQAEGGGRRPKSRKLNYSLVLGVRRGTIYSPSVARGELAQLILYVERRVCVRSHCRWRILSTRHRKLRISVPRTGFSLPRARRGEYVRVKLTVPPFTYAGIPYRGVTLTANAP